MEGNDVVRILELDRKLRKELAEAEKKRDQIENSIDQTLAKLHDEYYTKMNDQLEKYEKDKSGRTERRIAAQNAEYKKQLDAIDSKYSSDRKKWLDHIVGAVTEV